MQSRTVLISGLGIAGPALAFWLERYGFEPTLVEISPSARRGGYMIDFWGVGYDAAERMDLLPELREAGYRIDEVRLVDASNRRIAGIDGDLFRSALGARFLSILRGDLAFALFRRIEGRVPVVFGDEIASLKETAGGVEVEFRSGRSSRFDLVVGADGLHSVVRRVAFGPEARFERPLGFSTASFTAEAYPHRDEGAYTSYTEPGRQIARYALHDGRTAFFFVWSDDGRARPISAGLDAEEGAMRGGGLDAEQAAMRGGGLDVEQASIRGDGKLDAEKAAIREAFAGMAWEWPEIEPRLEAAPDVYADTVSQIRMPAWSKGRIALLGDAAYCPSLLAGQGAAFAIAGAYLLAGELAESEGDHARAFDRYERRFKPFVEKKQDAASSFGNQFAPKTAFALRLRNSLTSLMKLPLLGEWMMRKMVGDDFALPDYGGRVGAGGPTGGRARLGPRPT
ncbi:MAG TPA: FAD-dependent monooxygenase [Gammaproteobacteria bacterium]|nr:FAD-dependent monooxygenase [Gammaproteobacteria bacterium]